jgi:hypothetical protein
MAKYGRKILRQNILTRRRRGVNWGQLFSDKLTPACEGGLLIKTRFSVTHNCTTALVLLRASGKERPVIRLYEYSYTYVRVCTYRVPVSWFVGQQRMKKRLVRRKRLRSSENNHPKSGRIRCVHKEFPYQKKKAPIRIFFPLVPSVARSGFELRGYICIRTQPHQETKAERNGTRR